MLYFSAGKDGPRICKKESGWIPPLTSHISQIQVRVPNQEYHFPSPAKSPNGVDIKVDRDDRRKNLGQRSLKRVLFAIDNLEFP